MARHLFTPPLRASLLLPAALIAPALSAQGESSAYMGENPDRYAAVRTLEGDATVIKGDSEEPLSRGVPIAEGDVVESRGRGILQLADGSRLAFAPGTRFQVAALYQEREGDRQVLLRLDYGRLRISQGRDDEARIRIDTPAGTGTLPGNTSATFEVEPDRTVRVRVDSGRLAFANERDRTSLVAGERLTVYGSQDRLDRIRNFNTYNRDSFDEWSDRQMSVRRGPSWDRVPPELRYYSDDLDEHGEWIYVDEYRTWCWRPLGLSAEWRPYWRGRWAAYPGGMTWISDEPWGYVTYHHGRWGWSAGFGWYWIPGVYYAPAWVAWQSSDVYFGWAPLGYYNAPVAWGYGAWQGGYCWNVVEINYIHVYNLPTHVYSTPPVINRFNTPGASRPLAPGSGRPLTPPWQQGPLILNPAEFRNPAQIQRVVQDPGILQARVRSYESQGGRVVYRQSPAPPQPGTPRGFEDRSRLVPPPTPYVAPVPNRPLARPSAPRPVPQEQPVQPGQPGRVVQPPPNAGGPAWRPQPRPAPQPGAAAGAPGQTPLPGQVPPPRTAPPQPPQRPKPQPDGPAANPGQPGTSWPPPPVVPPTSKPRPLGRP